MPRNPFAPTIHVPIPPALKDEASLRAHLGMTAQEVKKIRWFRARMYQTFEIAKGSGKSRIIEAPDARLKYLQRLLLPVLRQLYRLRNPVHGFVEDRSVVTNARAHLRRRYLLNLDIKDFFTSITENRIVGVLEAVGVDRNVAELVGYITCNAGHLPQGAPTSPLLSNIICFRLDRELMALAKAARCIYTRYADDISFSSHQPIAALFEGAPPSAGHFSIDLLNSDLVKAFSGNGFQIHPNKAHYADKHSRRVVTGLKVNELLNVDRLFVRNLRAIFHSIATLGMPAAELKFAALGHGASLSAHLRGKIAWISNVKGLSDPVVRALAVQFNTHFPAQRIDLEPTQAERLHRSTWVIEHEQAQGTCFFVEDVGLVTAAHCVKGALEINVFHPSKPSNFFNATVAAIDADRDLAVLNHNIPINEFYELRITNTSINQGDLMTAVGYPNWGYGDQINVRPGVVSTLAVKMGIQLIEVTQKLTQGMSGGPVLDQDGDVAGVVHKGGPDEGRDFAVHASVLKEWLETLPSS